MLGANRLKRKEVFRNAEKSLEKVDRVPAGSVHEHFSGTRDSTGDRCCRRIQPIAGTIIQRHLLSDR